MCRLCQFTARAGPIVIPRLPRWPPNCAPKTADNNPIVRTGPLVVDLISRSATFGGEQIVLTKREYRLLHLLVWGKPMGESLQHLRALMRLLRRKIEPDPHRPTFLMTESGVGYRLEKHKEAMP